MSDKPQRTFKDVNIEYQKTCFKAGQLQYQIFALSKDLDAVNDVLRDLNIEGATLQAKEAEAAKAEKETKSNG